MAESSKVREGLAHHLGGIAREGRKRAGLTQADVAERVGLVPEVYARLERGGMLPSAITLLRLCETLGMDANEMLGLMGRPRPKWLEEALSVPTDSQDLRQLTRMVRKWPPAKVRMLIRILRMMESASTPEE